MKKIKTTLKFIIETQDDKKLDKKNFEITTMHCFIVRMRKSRAGKFNMIYYIMLNLPILDFLVGKLK